MAKYTVTIEETVSQGFEVEAESAEEAMTIAEQKYNDGEFVLEPGEALRSSPRIRSGN